MRDKRPVDELSIEELERILAIRKREARLARVRRYDDRRITVVPETHDDVDEVDDQDDVPQVMPQLPTQAVSQAVSPNVPQPAPQIIEPEAVDAPPVYYEGEPQFEDEFTNPRPLKPELATADPRRLMINRTLLGVEIVATIGLVGLFVFLLQALQGITRATAEVQESARATSIAAIVPPTATPQIGGGLSVVLPGGHVWQENGEGIFNVEEIPVEYRPRYFAEAQQVSIAPPEQSAEHPVRIQIPKIGVDEAVYYGDTFDILKLGVGQMIGSANPGQIGNMVLSAHNDIYGEIFRDLDKLSPGDEIIVHTTSRTYTYVVESTEIVRPRDTWVLDQGGGYRRATLISCYPYRVNNRRIAVFALLRENAAT
jgi:sortase A